MLLNHKTNIERYLKKSESVRENTSCVLNSRSNLISEKL